MHKGTACVLENTKVNEFGHLESPMKSEIIPVTPPEYGGMTHEYIYLVQDFLILF